MVKSKQFNEASELFKIYFEIYDFYNTDNVKDFIYPFVKWYQCEIHLGNKTAIEHLEKLSSELIKHYREKLGKAYFEKISGEHEAYKSLRDSQDSFDKEKFEILEKVFIDNKNS